MAKLILKSPYIKSTGGASGYLKYIATRERVEIIPDDRPPTRKQEQLITKLVKDFPEVKELYEYGDYMDKPTKANASAFITLALESNWDSVMQSERYMKYIATRPRAERLGEHGLFGDSDGIDLDAAMNELENYAGNVWTHIISLKRKDAARLGFDNAAAWRDLLRAHRNDIAAAMKIPSNDFRWYAAFHDEGEHPHVHMMAWSAKPGQAYLSKDGIRQIKSTLTNHIFQNEMLHLYEQKSVSRDELVRDARKAMLEMVRSMKEGICNHPDAERLMLELALQLETVKGKKSYGYLPKPQKKLVDRIVDEMERLPSVRKCYEQWQILQGKVDAYYHDKELKQTGQFSVLKSKHIFKLAAIFQYACIILTAYNPLHISGVSLNNLVQLVLLIFIISKHTLKKSVRQSSNHIIFIDFPDKHIQFVNSLLISFNAVFYSFRNSNIFHRRFFLQRINKLPLIQRNIMASLLYGFQNDAFKCFC